MNSLEARTLPIVRDVPVHNIVLSACTNKILLNNRKNDATESKTRCRNVYKQHRKDNLIYGV